MARQNSKNVRKHRGSSKSAQRYSDDADFDGAYADEEGQESSEEEIMIIHESDRQRVKRKARAAKAKIQRHAAPFLHHVLAILCSP